jgi:Fe-S-cluster-containing dehydrogenase component
MVINTERCMGCMTCVVSCHENNQLPDDFYFNKVETEGNHMYIPTGTSPNLKIKLMPQQCNHCEEPACKNACPFNAISITTSGIVSVDRDVCASCGSCVTACPYSNIKLDPVYNRGAKCTLCENRILNGEEPFCVKSCPAKARKIGNLSDTNSEVSTLIREKNGYVLKPEQNTKPKVYYIPGS